MAIATHTVKTKILVELPSLECLVVLHQGATNLPLEYLATLDVITLTFLGEDGRYYLL